MAVNRHRTRAPDRLRLVLYSDATDLGGAEIGARYLLEFLDDRIDATVVGHDRTVLERIAGARPQTATVLVPAIGNRNDLRAIGAHLRAFRALRPDIVQANLQTPWASRYAILTAVLTRGANAIAVEHLPLAPSSPRQARLKRWLSKRLRAHIAVGERSARELERLWGLEPGSVRTIHNGVPQHAVGSAAPSRGEFVIGSIGRLHPQKGYDVLLEAAAEVPGSTVVLIGDGTEREALEKLALERNVHERTVFVGWLDDPRPELAAFDVFVLPSRWEAFPLSILEAMLAGVAVVATNVGSVREVVLDGETGLLVAPNDSAGLARAIQTLNDQPELRRGLADAGQAFAKERFTAGAMARAYEELYDELVS